MRRATRWNVRNRFMVAFIVVAVIPLVVFGALVYSRTANALRQIEHEKIVAQTTGAREVLRQRISEQRAFIHDYAVWDEFHAALRGSGHAWIRNNVTDWVPANSTTNMVAVFGHGGHVVAHGGDRAPGTLWASDLVQAARRGEIGADIRSMNGRLYVIAAAPVIAQTYPSKPATMFVALFAGTQSVTLLLIQAWSPPRTAAWNSSQTA